MYRFILETKRCYVREITVDDVPLEYELYDSPHMCDFIEPLLPIEQEIEYQKLYKEKIYDKYGFGMWAVFEKGTDRLIGEAGLEHRPDINREKFPYEWMWAMDASELGFCFAEDIWGQGYCTEVCRGILHYGINTLGHNRFFARAVDDNVASVRVLTKLGFTKYPGSDRVYRLDITEEDKDRYGKDI